MTTITVPRAVLEQALETLDEIWSLGFRSTGDRHKDAITTLRAALAQQEQDAEAWVDKGSIAWLGEQRSLQRRKVRSRREWQSLSEDEIDHLWLLYPCSVKEMDAYARAIEAKLKEKNA
jgi:hypothetical protein